MGLRYYVARCPKCGNIQVSSTKYSFFVNVYFNCRVCKKQTKLINSKGYEVLKIYFVTDDPKLASDFAIELKENY